MGPPQLIFDDGSRVMVDEAAPESGSQSDLKFSRGSSTVYEFYELERVAEELLQIHVRKISEDKRDGLRVALQFPDSMLCDAADACWGIQAILERKILTRSGEDPLPLVFCLGDTTVGSCCPDEVAALHLEADILVHYGHACLSPTGSLPVIYSFGLLPIDVPEAVGTIAAQIESTKPATVLLLYEVGYHHAINQLKESLSKKCGVPVIIGQIPTPSDSPESSQVALPARACCGGTSANEGGDCCSSSMSDPNCSGTGTNRILEKGDSAAPDDHQSGNENGANISIVLGGLEIRIDDGCTWKQISQMSVIFIGDNCGSSRQYLHAMLRLLSLPNPPEHVWTYSPTEKILSTSISPVLSRQLQRRFYLTERARTATTFGIVVSSLSQRHVVRLIYQLQQRIQDSGKASYTFAVGKINPAKLANFGEIDCFVLVACSEQSLLEGERDYHVPIVTPLELSIALGHLSWGERVYSLDCNDVLVDTSAVVDGDGRGTETKGDIEDSDEDNDAPFFSLATGKYEQRTKKSDDDDTNLKALPGHGELMVYQSEAANFLKNREYQGLQVQAGQTEVHIARQGQTGIASGYEKNDIPNAK